MISHERLAAMPDFTKWTAQDVEITALSLDQNNPRIPTSGKDMSQRKLIAELCEHDKVAELAREIVEHGYFPVESLVAIKSEGKTIVVEGNRRLPIKIRLVTQGVLK
jgi:predicted PilT family ATPase